MNIVMPIVAIPALAILICLTLKNFPEHMDKVQEEENIFTTICYMAFWAIVIVGTIYGIEYATRAILKLLHIKAGYTNYIRFAMIFISLMLAVKLSKR